MNFTRLRAIFSVVTLAVGLTSLRAQATAEEQASWTKAADNKIFAQQLVNELVAAHSELLVVGFHALAPGTKEQKMIATNLDRVGKKDDDDDIAVFAERKTILVPNAKEPNKFEVQLPMKDATGKIIGAYGFVFQYKAGDDEVAMLAKATMLREALAKRIPNLAALFEPVK
jgi:hypothetical protein